MKKEFTLLILTAALMMAGSGMKVAGQSVLDCTNAYGGGESTTLTNRTEIGGSWLELSGNNILWNQYNSAEKEDEVTSCRIITDTWRGQKAAHTAVTMCEAGNVDSSGCTKEGSWGDFFCMESRVKVASLS